MKKTADIIAIAHLLLVIFGVLLLPLVIKTDNYDAVILIGVGVLILSWIFFRGCALLIWEQNLRKKYDPKNFYDTAFLSHYIKKLTNINISKISVRLLIYSYLASILVIIFTR